MSCSIKICGITNVEDALIAEEAGADYLGVLVDVPRSPRSLTLARAKGIFVNSKKPVVLLTFDLAPERVIELGVKLKPFAIQLAGNETEKEVGKLRKTVSCEIWKTLHVPAAGEKKVKINDIVRKIDNFAEAGVDRIVLDSEVIKSGRMQKGGTGRTFDWFLAREIKDQVEKFIFLAGGISPENVEDAILQVNPDGIDLSSGVESSPGKKNPHLVRSLIDNVKNTELSVQIQR